MWLFIEAALGSHAHLSLCTFVKFTEFTATPISLAMVIRDNIVVAQSIWMSHCLIYPCEMSAVVLVPAVVGLLIASWHSIHWWQIDFLGKSVAFFPSNYSMISITLETWPVHVNGEPSTIILCCYYIQDHFTYPIFLLQCIVAEQVCGWFTSSWAEWPIKQTTILHFFL